jgi:hypothetical protein
MINMQGSSLWNKAVGTVRDADATASVQTAHGWHGDSQ